MGQFVIGRAGTGKTHLCLAALHAALGESPIDGPPLILLVPEQATLQMELALLSGPVSATGRARVLSFSRLAHHVLARQPGGLRPALSETARAMVLRSLLGRLRPNLRYYRRAAGLTGFIHQLGGAIGELIDAAAAPDELRPIAEQANVSPDRAAKLLDLADLYAAYLAYLGEERVDPAQYLPLATEILRQDALYRGAGIWVDGFAGYTQQELRLLAEVGRQASSLTITLLADPQALTAPGADADETALFARPVQTRRQVEAALSAAGVEFSPPKLLDPPVIPRFERSPDLGRLEARLAASTGSDQAPPASTGSEPAPVAVRLVHVSDRRTEVDYAVHWVMEQVRTSVPPLRYRDVAIIVRDLEPYHDLLAAALTERGVPFFLDRRRSVSHHPLVELVRSVAQIHASNWDLDAVRTLLKTGLTGLDDDEADGLENHVLRYGLAGQATWYGDDWVHRPRDRRGKEPSPRTRQHLQRVNAARRTLVDWLAPMHGPVDTLRSGRDWADRFVAVLEHSGVTTALEGWIAAAAADGLHELAATHRQTAESVRNLLDELAAALADDDLSPVELSAILDAGLAQLSIGLTPPTIDQVLVGEIERSRHPEIKAAVLLGVNDGVFPGPFAESAILNDDDRALLRGRDIAVGPRRRERVVEEALLFYVATTRASRALLVTFAAADSEARPLRRSPYIDRLTGALPGLAAEPIGNPAELRATWPILSRADLVAGLAAEMSVRRGLVTDESPRRREWNDLYELARRSYAEDRLLHRALAGLDERRLEVLSAPVAAALIGATLSTSVSALESFAACPFQHFANNLLRLEPRKEAELDVLDLGTLYHEVLEKLVDTCISGTESIGQIDADELQDRLAVCADRVSADVMAAGPLATPRDQYLVEHTGNQLAPIVEGQRQFARAGQYRPKATEKGFGFGGGESLPALELVLSGDRRVKLRGFIDRIDLADIDKVQLGAVIDYKRTRDRQLDLVKVYHGLSLQLLGYLLVLAEHGKSLTERPIVPAGALYVTLMPQYQSVRDPNAADIPSSSFKARGLVNVEHRRSFDAKLESGFSQVIQMFLKTDGQLGRVNQSDAVAEPVFNGLLDHVRECMMALASAIMDGQVAVAPYRLADFSPCHWCDFASVCGFEMGDAGMRHLEHIGVAELGKKLTKKEK